MFTARCSTSTATRPPERTVAVGGCHTPRMPALPALAARPWRLKAFLRSMQPEARGRRRVARAGPGLRRHCGIVCPAPERVGWSADWLCPCPDCWASAARAAVLRRWRCCCGGAAVLLACRVITATQNCMRRAAGEGSRDCLQRMLLSGRPVGGALGSAVKCGASGRAHRRKGDLTRKRTRIVSSAAAGTR